MFKKGDKADPSNFRGISLLNTVSKPVFKSVSDIMEKMVEKETIVGDKQAGFRPYHSCEDNVYTFDKITEGKRDAGLTAHSFS